MFYPYFTCQATGPEGWQRPWALTLSTVLGGGDGVMTVGSAYLRVTARCTSLLLASVVSIFISFLFSYIA